MRPGLLTADKAQAEWGYYNLGNFYFAAGLYPEAARAYQQALLIDPNDADARYNLELALKKFVRPATIVACPNSAVAQHLPSNRNPTPTSQPRNPHQMGRR